VSPRERAPLPGRRCRDQRLQVTCPAASSPLCFFVWSSFFLHTIFVLCLYRVQMSASVPNTVLLCAIIDPQWLLHVLGSFSRALMISRVCKEDRKGPGFIRVGLSRCRDQKGTRRQRILGQGTCNESQHTMHGRTQAPCRFHLACHALPQVGLLPGATRSRGIGHSSIVPHQ